MNIDSYKHIYLIGVGGIGMSALARYFNAKGKNVSGYDKERSDLCIELEEEGINIHYTDESSAIPESLRNSADNNILIIYTPAIPQENQIFSFFRNQGFEILKRSEVLGMISKQSFTIAIAGTHGKTTTSTMLAHILEQAGKETTAFLGGISRNYKTNLLLAEKGNILIVEADEYDRSFLQIHADVAIITSVEADHLDIYKNKSDLDLAFKQFASQVKEEGLLLVEESIALDFPVPNRGVRLIYSANTKADYFVENIRVINGKMIFDMILDRSIHKAEKEVQKDIELQMPGVHNISNAVAASAVAFYLGLTCDDIVEGLVTFKGITRRFDKHIDTEELVYIDDYAHHPEEVSATIDTTKQLYPSRDLLVVFQPHLFSRTKDFINEFAASLQRADDLVLLNIYPAREKPIAGINSQALLDLCNNTKKELCSKDELLSVLGKKNLDVLLTLGAGDIGTLVRPIKHMLN
ncbi:MAG: UDP-N-acetylmuramate--L-alanine ligase [Bacteroidota bacterium]|nr:UDP-N-acetylmuramate--L-alanine ligase [Bacteroidota bacterium]